MRAAQKRSRGSSERPQVEIDDLRTVDRREPHDLSCVDRERVAGPHRHDRLADALSSIVLRCQSLDQVGVGSQRAVASGDIRGVRHARSMPYADEFTTG